MTRKAAAAEQVQLADLTGRHILLTEDIPINAEILTDLLELREMTADHAENGKIAVDLFAQSELNTYDAIRWMCACRL